MHLDLLLQYLVLDINLQLQQQDTSRIMKYENEEMSLQECILIFSMEATPITEEDHNEPDNDMQFDGLAQGCVRSIANTLELPKSCTNLSN